jgi:hypothetical protein
MASGSINRPWRSEEKAKGLASSPVIGVVSGSWSKKGFGVRLIA